MFNEPVSSHTGEKIKKPSWQYRPMFQRWTLFFDMAAISALASCESWRTASVTPRCAISCRAIKRNSRYTLVKLGWNLSSGVVMPAYRPRPRTFFVIHCCQRLLILDILCLVYIGVSLFIGMLRDRHCTIPLLSHIMIFVNWNDPNSICQKKTPKSCRISISSVIHDYLMSYCIYWRTSVVCPRTYSLQRVILSLPTASFFGLLRHRVPSSIMARCLKLCLRNNDDGV